MLAAVSSKATHQYRKIKGKGLMISKPLLNVSDQNKASWSIQNATYSSFNILNSNFPALIEVKTAQNIQSGKITSQMKNIKLNKDMKAVPVTTVQLHQEMKNEKKCELDVQHEPQSTIQHGNTSSQQMIWVSKRNNIQTDQEFLATVSEINVEDLMYISTRHLYHQFPHYSESVEKSIPTQISRTFGENQFMLSAGSKVSGNAYKLNLMKDAYLINSLKEDTLFFIFYFFPQQYLQMQAATELFIRHWRFHMTEKVWVSRVDTKYIIETTQNYERGVFYVFEPIRWIKCPIFCTLEYAKLEMHSPLDVFLLH